MNRPFDRLRNAVRVAAGAVLAGTLLVVTAGVADAAPAQTSSHQIQQRPADSTW